MPYSAPTPGAIFDTNQEDGGVVAFVPPRAIKSHIYRCDSKFLIDDLLPLYESKARYAIVHVEGEEAKFYQVHGQDVTCVETITTFIKNKHKRGGQSQNRFQRLRCIQIDQYVSTVADTLVQLVRTDNMTKIFVLGAWEKRRLMLQKLPTDILNKCVEEDRSLADIVTSYDPSNDVVNPIVTQFYETLIVDPQRVVYGEIETKRALDMGALDYILVEPTAAWIDAAAAKNTIVVDIHTHERFLREFRCGGIARYQIPVFDDFHDQ